MGYNLAPAVLFCITTWMASLHITSGHPSTCCTTNHNTMVRLKNIVGYKVQLQGFCPIKSVAFLTKQNKWVCWDPEEPYAQRAMKKVNQLSREREVTIPTPTKEMTVSQTTAQLSSSNSTQTQVHKVMVREVDNSERKKNSRRKTKKGKRRNKRRRM